MPVGAFELAARSIHGLASCEPPLKHLGISSTPKKSTLAYANANRPWELSELIFMRMLEKCQTETVATQLDRILRVVITMASPVEV